MIKSHIYNLIIKLYGFLIHLSSLFNKKAKLWVNGRKNWREELKKYNNKFSNTNDFKIWIHSASLGEFEQARPVIDELKKWKPKSKIICTFFSPSGYEIRKNYKDADWVTYLPLDTKQNAKFWVETLKPNLVLWVKYDIWLNFLTEIKKNQIPCILFSSIFRKNQIYFKPYGNFFKQGLQSFTHIFVQNKFSKKLLNHSNIQHCSVANDTRFDRVFDTAQNPKNFPYLKTFSENEKVLIAGSTWEKDEDILALFINNQQNNNWKIVIAPHEINETKLAKLEAKLNVSTIRFSEIKKQEINDLRVIIIDCIGLLSSIYQYGNIAYIGGGFGAGIHNILEAAVFDLPIIFGSKHHKFKEAKDLINLKGAKSIANYREFETAVAFFETNKVNNQQYIKENLGGAKIILLKVKNIC